MLGGWACRMGAVGLALGVIPGCIGASTFACASDEQCQQSGAAGRCEPSGYCSFPDGSCPSGWRYEANAGDGLGVTCVDPDGGSGTTTSTSGTTTTGPGSTSVAPTTTSATSTGPSGTDTGSTGMTPMVTVTLGEGDGTDFSGVTRDAWIRSASPTDNAGDHFDIHVMDANNITQVGLLRFDVSVLPADAQVTSVTLSLWTAQFVHTVGTVRIHRLLEEWDEGTQDIAPGICNWVERTPEAAWSSPGAGVDSFDPAVLAEFTALDPDARWDVELPPALVQAWIDDPGGNFGIALRPNGIGPGVLTFGSKEAEAGLRPALSVTYLP